MPGFAHGVHCPAAVMGRSCPDALRLHVSPESSGQLVSSKNVADENHAVRFAVLDNVKNAWVRDVTTLHLEHSLANVLRQAKWVTVQD